MLTFKKVQAEFMKVYPEGLQWLKCIQNMVMEWR